MRTRVIRAEKELRELLWNGWEIAHSTGMDGVWWAQNGGIGQGGESATVAVNVALKLLRAGELKGTARSFPNQTYIYSPHPPSNEG